jgi:hypothetical protein
MWVCVWPQAAQEGLEEALRDALALRCGLVRMSEHEEWPWPQLRGSRAHLDGEAW